MNTPSNSITIPISRTYGENYKWYVLTLAALTHTIVVAIPTMSLPVLFKEISQDLGLTLVQVGWIWGMGSLMGIFMGVVGGSIGDRFGPKNTLIVACLLSGIVSAMRGLATDFVSLFTAIFLWGMIMPAIPMNVHKTCGVWFGGPRLGLANGVVSVGMAFGFMLGSLLAATLLSPLLGGWRNVFIFYGFLSALMSILWYFTHSPEGETSAKKADQVSLRESLSHVARLRNIWILGLATFGVAASIQGTLGYLPLYLRELGWSGANADSAAATFHAVSMFAALPLVLLSDYLGRRKQMLMISAFLIALGVGLLSVADGILVWVAVLVAGIMRDGYMAILMTTSMEVKGIGAKYAGTATGLIMVFLGTGNVVSPPLGNSLAQFAVNLPFVFWAALSMLGFFGFTFLRDDRK